MKLYCVSQIKDICWPVTARNDQSTIFTMIRNIGKFKPESDMMIIVNKREGPGNHARNNQESDLDKNGSTETRKGDLI